MSKKESTSKSVTTTKKTAKKEVVKYTASDVVLTKAQSKTLEMVEKNQDRILSNAEAMLKIGFDSGQRLMKLKEEIQSKFGRVWKTWAQTEGNLSIGYEQASRYMKLAGATDDEFAALESTSIESAVKEIEYLRKPEKKAAAEKAAADKKAAGNKKQKIATAGIISNATLDEVEQCTDISELRGLIKLCHARIEELEDVGDEVEESDDNDDIADIIG